MQKNKKLLYILIPGTLLVWGIIIYKIFSVINNKDEVNTMANKVTMEDAKTQIIADTFTISANYRDPFLGKLPKTVSNISLPKKEIPIQKTIIAQQWPVIIYSGIIKNQQSQKQLILVQINEQNNTMKVGDVINGIELMKVFRDSIEVKFNKEKKYIKK